ncbi:MAG TPA: vitamin K epoxide reductase family protein, partial [Verrucomicrobiae bacterium]|nr:vitamin K epoxide reductase family protein [Verrucomicrobiae bacterium]
MSARKKKHRRPATSPSGPVSTYSPLSSGRLVIVRLCLALALAVSAYLAFLSLTGGRAVGCGPASGCDKVLQSRWAYWFGVPVSVFALLADTLVLAATFRLGKLHAPSVQRRAWLLLVPGAILIAGAAVWFTLLQAAIVQSFCPYCMVAHASGFIAALLILVTAPVRTVTDAPADSDKAVFLKPAVFWRLTGLAVLGLAVLAGGQIAHRPATFVLQSVDSLSSPTSATPATASSATASLTPPPPPPAPAPSTAPMEAVAA